MKFGANLNIRRLCIIFAGIVFATAIFGGFYLFAKRDALLREVLDNVEQKATSLIGTKVKIGNATLEELEISSLKDSALVVDDIEIYDADDELMAKVNRARVTFKLLSFYDAGAGAIDQIDVSGVQAHIKQRADESWNFEDIKTDDSGESTFRAKVNLRDGSVTADFGGKNISVTEINAAADCADMNAIDAELSAVTLGSHVTAKGTVGSDRQIINAFIDTADITKILAYLPADTLPESVEILGGTASGTVLNILRRGEVLSYSGSTNVSGGAVLVMDTEIKNITGRTNFTDAKYNIEASAEANGQTAKASGYIRLDTDELYFDFDANSDSFAPAAVIENIGIDGAAGFTAHVFGTAKDPKVDAEIYSDYIGYEKYSARNVRTNFRYVNNSVYLSNIYAETFGGAVTGEFELNAQSLSYNSHLKANGINLAQVVNTLDVAAPVSGNLSCDIALNGKDTDMKNLTVYGQLGGDNLYYKNFLVNDFESSFYFKEDDVEFDYLKLRLPNGGAVSLTGTLVDANKLDFEIYGSHCDLALAKTLEPSIKISGLSDFTGAIHGDLDNPNVTLKLSAVGDLPGNFKGEIFNQPYDSLILEMSGSLDAVNVSEFELVKDGNVQWQVMDGWVNFKERKLNVRLDTIGARLEGLVALLAPDQELTGEFDNTIRVQGSFEKPELVGYVEMHYGSYSGILISGMRGDYYIEDNDKFRLQDFEIVTPMVDMVLNGTLNIKTYALDMVVRGREIDLKRFSHQFPYEVSGVGTFEGLIGGTIDSPRFDGQLTSDEFVFNGVSLKNITGHIGATARSVVLDETKFDEGRGKYGMYLGVDLDSGSMSGEINVEHANINSLAALANYQTKLISGELTSNIEIGGTLNNPTVRVLGAIPQGKVGNYDFHDLQLDVNLINHVANINTFKGYQGTVGELEIAGSADLHGALDLRGSAKNIEMGLLGALTGIDAQFVGDANVDVKISGDINNPVGELLLAAHGGIKGSTFDLLKGEVHFKDWTFDVKELTVERTVNEKLYKAEAKGTIPVEALYIENVNPSAQMNLEVSLDEADLSLLPVISKAIDWATGEMDGRVLITGTAANPQINGNISVKSGQVKVKAMKTLIENFNIDTEFVGEKFIIDDISGNIGTGKFTLRGGLSFADFTVRDYTLDFMADNLDIRSNFFTGPLNAVFELREEQVHDRYLPKITGKVDLEKCTFSIPSLPDSEGELPEILLDVSINLGDKVHFYSSRLYNMYLTGSVRYEGSTLHQKPSGAITVKRGGTVNYLQTVFNVREGELYFNQIGSFLPSVNFLADTRVSNVRVELAVSGTIDNMQIKLTSNPEKTETEIMQLLTLRDAYGNSTSSMSMADVLAIGLQMSILGDIEDSIKRTLGLDRFTFGSGSGSALDSFSSREPNERSEEKHSFHISIGKYVSDKVMLKYTQGFGGDRVTRYGIQYDINDNLGVTVERENSEYIFSLEARYKF